MSLIKYDQIGYNNVAKSLNPVLNEYNIRL